MLGKSHFYKMVLLLVKTITHQFWTCKNDFSPFYVKLTIVRGGGADDFNFVQKTNRNNVLYVTLLAWPDIVVKEMK